LNPVLNNYRVDRAVERRKYDFEDGDLKYACVPFQVGQGERSVGSVK
jgi:hypothetical protein